MKKYKIVLNRTITDTPYGVETHYLKGMSWELHEDALKFCKKEGYYTVCHGHGVYTYLQFPKWFDVYEIDEVITRTEKKIDY